jgi:organic radical activating enzyme
MRVEGGKLRVPSLEFFLSDRCNLRCRHCSSSSPYLSEGSRPRLAVFRDVLRAIGGVLASDQLKLLGGEPLLNPAIVSFMEVARSSGVFERIRVVTNGILLPRMDDRLWELADVVEVSLYPSAPGPSEEQLRRLAEKAARLGTQLEARRISRFMVAVSDSRIDETAIVQRVFANCGEAHGWSCHLLYGSRLYRCSRVHTIDRYLESIGVAHESFVAADGLELLGKSPQRLLSDIEAYLRSSLPLAACRFCLGTAGRWEASRQLEPKEILTKRRGARDPFSADLLISAAEASSRARIATWRDAEKRGLVPSRGVAETR